MSLWWLTLSPAELYGARMCRVCGCHDADIDLGLCYDCFCRQQAGPEPVIDPQNSQEYEDYCKQQIIEAFEGFEGFEGEGI